MTRIKTPTIQDLLALANDEQRISSMFKRYGFWLMAREGQKRVHILKKHVVKMARRERRRLKK